MAEHESLEKGISKANKKSKRKCHTLRNPLKEYGGT